MVNSLIYHKSRVRAEPNIKGTVFFSSDVDLIDYGIGIERTIDVREFFAGLTVLFIFNIFTQGRNVDNQQQNFILIAE